MGLRAKLVLRLKWALAGALYATGLLQLWIRFALRGKAVVLMYHRVLSEAGRARTWSHPHIVVSTATFERHVQVIRRLFDVVSLEEFVAHIESGRPFERPACLITFDDGWRDTYTEAWPVLRRYGVPAVVFLPVDYIGTGRTFWQEQLSALLFTLWKDIQRDSAKASEVKDVLRPYGLDAVLEAPAPGVRGAIAALVRARKYDDRDRIGGLVDALRAFVGEQGESRGHADTFLTWEQVREMASDGIAFGGHGAEHAILTAVPVTAAAREVERSLSELCRRLGRAPVAFSYPNGNWNPEVAGLVRRAGYRIAFATGRKPFSSPFALKRVNIEEEAAGSAPMLLARAAGLF